MLDLSTVKAKRAMNKQPLVPNTNIRCPLRRTSRIWPDLLLTTGMHTDF